MFSAQIGVSQRNYLSHISSRLEFIRRIFTRLEFLFFLILCSFLVNIFLTRSLHSCFLSSEISSPSLRINCKNFDKDLITTIERSKQALETLKTLLDSVRSPTDQQWIWTPSQQYPSVPYQPTLLLNQTIPQVVSNKTILPQSVVEEINRVCERLNRAHSEGGTIWCQLFNKNLCRYTANNNKAA